MAEAEEVVTAGGLAAAGERTLPRLFQGRVQAHGRRVALREKRLGLWTDVSWEEYGGHVRAVAGALLASGCTRGDRVAIIGENCPQWLYADLGATSIGAVSVGVYPTSAAAQVQYVLADSGATVVFVENEEQLDKVLEVRGGLADLRTIVYWDDDGLQEFSDAQCLSFEGFLDRGRGAAAARLIDERMAELRESDVAVLVYTSGTTGPPKGVMLTQRNLLSASTAIGLAHPVSEADEVLSFLPLCHIAERTWSITHAIQYGYTVNFVESGETLFEDLRDLAPTVFFAVPRIWEKMYAGIVLGVRDGTRLEQAVFRAAMALARRVASRRLDRQAVPLLERLGYRIFDRLVYANTRRMLGLARCHFIFSGGAPIAPDILFFFHGLGLRMREIYGQTEATGPVSMHQGDDIRLGTVGKPFPGVEVRIAPDGEILVRGDNVCEGYFNDEALTRATVVDGWLHTGDVGALDGDGNLLVTDRKKDIIITAGGKNVTPQYLENQLKFSPYVNDAIVIGDRRRYLTALIMIDEENVVKYAQEARIPFTTYASLARSADVNRLIEAEVETVNRRVSSVEQIKRLRLIDVKLSTEDNEITPTMKLKRRYMEERFKDLIDEMYEA